MKIKRLTIVNETYSRIIEVGIDEVNDIQQIDSDRGPLYRITNNENNCTTIVFPGIPIILDFFE